MDGEYGTENCSQPCDQSGWMKQSQAVTSRLSAMSLDSLAGKMWILIGMRFRNDE